MIRFEDAQEIILSEAISFGKEKLPLKQCFGRVLSESISSDRDYPPFNRAAMDGFALSSKDFETGKPFPFERELPAGSNLKVNEGEKAIRIMTGAPVPLGFDMVVKIEDCELKESNGQKYVTFLLKNTKPWLNIAKQGEDLQAGEIIINENVTLGTSEISILASLGKSSVDVCKLPKVNVVSTGNEIVPINEKPLNHQIRNSNLWTISSILNKYKIQVNQSFHANDAEPELRNIISKGLDSNILILSGGVSMGNLDLVPSILRSLGVEILFHKTKIKPGKPILFGKKNSTFVFALPGNPFSVQTCARIFLEPFLQTCFGQKITSALRIPLLEEREKKHSLTEFFPVRLKIEDQTYLTSVSYNGSGDIRAGYSSHGLAVFPEDQMLLKSGEMVRFIPW